MKSLEAIAQRLRDLSKGMPRQVLLPNELRELADAIDRAQAVGVKISENAREQDDVKRLRVLVEFLADLGKSPDVGDEFTLKNAAAIRSVLARLEAAEADADRYRWLRDECDTTTGFLLGQRVESDEWDETIDAARGK